METVECYCGCRTLIEVKPWHKYRGEKRFVRGHNMKSFDMTNVQKLHVQKSKEKWKMFKLKHENNECMCGCLTTIKIQKHHMNRGVPDFIHGHHPKITYKNKKHTLNTRIKFSLGHTKEKIFKGFKRKLTERIRNSSKYARWRKKIFEEDKYTCKECKTLGGYLEVHHIKAFSTILKECGILSLPTALNCNELWNTDNGVTLCLDCHKNTDNFRR